LAIQQYIAAAVAAPAAAAADAVSAAASRSSSGGGGGGGRDTLWPVAAATCRSEMNYGRFGVRELRVAVFV